MTVTADGILPAQAIQQLIDEGAIRAGPHQFIVPKQDFDADQIQPASLDLRVGDLATRVRASFLPGPDRTVANRLADLRLHEIDLTNGAVLETGCVYIVSLIEGSRAAGRHCRLGQSQILDGSARHLHSGHRRQCPGLRFSPSGLFRTALSRGQPADLPDRPPRRLATVANPFPSWTGTARRFPAFLPSIGNPLSLTVNR